MRTVICTIVISIIIITLAIVPFGCSNGYTYDGTQVDVIADVLSVNQNILRGKMVGEFHASASGAIADDTNVVGVSFTIGADLFLEDLELSHSMLAHYAGKNKLPLECRFYRSRSDRYRMEMRINGYGVGKTWFSKEGMNRILGIELGDKT